MGSGAAFGELVANHARDQILARNEAKNRIVEVNRTGGLAVEGGNVDLHALAPVSSPATPPEAASAIRYLPGFGASFGSAFFTASRT